MFPILLFFICAIIHVFREMTLGKPANLFLFIVLIHIGCYRCSFTGITRDEIMDYIFKNYRRNERPVETNQTRVMVFMKVLSINSVNVSNMEYSTDLYLRQSWIDVRLRWDNLQHFKKFNSSIASPSLKDRLWLPDLFFRNGKEGYVHKMTKPNYLMRLFPNGKVLYSQKITMRFSCQMELQTYPMDTQTCEMNIGSYGYTLDQLLFYWSDSNPMELGNDVQIPEFNAPTKVETNDCTNSSATSTGLYACLKALFTLKRQLGSYLVSTFIPNTLIVMVSWLNFWVSVEAVPARITLGLLTLLGILTQASGISGNLPRVSYIKAIDVWLIACIVFVIGALLEFAVASTVAQQKKLCQWKTEVRDIVRQELSRWNLAIHRQQTHHMQTSQMLNLNELAFCEELDLLLTAQHYCNNYQHEDAVLEIKRQKMLSEIEESKIDIYSRYLFPSCFILYNFCYWIYYLVIVSY